MIRINLLPEEYRRSDRTSPKVFAATLLAVIIVCSAFGWFALVYFGEVEELRLQHAAVEETRIGVAKRATYYDSLVRERKEFSKRSDTIRSIAKSRMLWTKIIDELIDVVNNNQERHISWFSSLAIKGGNSKVGPSVTLPAAVQGKNITRVADFYDDLKGASFYRDIRDMSLPSAKKKTSKGRYPPTSYAFSLKWTFKPAKQWVRNKVGAKPGK